MNEELLPCKAMKSAGIEDPESRAGIEFCTEKCPYDYCIQFEKRMDNRKYVKRAQWRKSKTRELSKAGWTPQDMAAKLGVTQRTIERYLEEEDNA